METTEDHKYTEKRDKTNVKIVEDSSPLSSIYKTHTILKTIIEPVAEHISKKNKAASAKVNRSSL
jgi:hypothetical protein